MSQVAGSIDVGEWKEISASKKGPGIPPLGSNTYSCPCSNCRAVLRESSLGPTGTSGEGGDIPACVRIGDRVLVHASLPGVVRYVGDLDSDFTSDQMYVGVKLDDPVGEHDGMYKDKRYFKCPDNHGMIVPIEAVHILVPTDGRELKIADDGCVHRPISTPAFGDHKTSASSRITVSSTCPCFNTNQSSNTGMADETPSPSRAYVQTAAPSSRSLPGRDQVSTGSRVSAVIFAGLANPSEAAISVKSAPSAAVSARSFSVGVATSRDSVEGMTGSYLKWVNSAPETSLTPPSAGSVRQTRSALVKGEGVKLVPGLEKTREVSRSGSEDKSAKASSARSLALTASTASRDSVKGKMAVSPLTVSRIMSGPQRQEGEGGAGRSGAGEEEMEEDPDVEEIPLQDCLAPKPPDSDKLQKEPMKGDAASRSHEKPPPAAPKVAFMSAGPETEVGGAGNDSGDCKEIIQMSSFTSRLYSSLPLKEVVTPPSPRTQLADVQEFAVWVQVWGGGVQAWAMARTLEKLKHAQRTGEKEVQWQRSVFTLENNESYAAQIQRINILRDEISRVRAAREVVERETREKTFSNTHQNQCIESLKQDIQVEDEHFNGLMVKLNRLGVAHLAQRVNQLLAENDT